MGPHGVEPLMGIQRCELSLYIYKQRARERFSATPVSDEGGCVLFIRLEGCLHEENSSM